MTGRRLLAGYFSPISSRLLLAAAACYWPPDTGNRLVAANYRLLLPAAYDWQHSTRCVDPVRLTAYCWPLTADRLLLAAYHWPPTTPRLQLAACDSPPKMGSRPPTEHQYPPRGTGRRRRSGMAHAKAPHLGAMPESASRAHRGGEYLGENCSKIPSPPPLHDFGASLFTQVRGFTVRGCIRRSQP